MTECEKLAHVIEGLEALNEIEEMRGLIVHCGLSMDAPICD